MPPLPDQHHKFNSKILCPLTLTYEAVQKHFCLISLNKILPKQQAMEQK